MWLSEIMLQQTRVETVVPYFRRFLAAFPTVHALAEAPVDQVLARWSGLGYYRRARMLHAAAKVVSAGGGAFPDTVEGLRAIPGIGAYTAGAVASIAFGKRAPLVDGNVARVFARLFAIEDDVREGKGKARVWEIAERLVPARDPGSWNQALMELGATVCTPRSPACDGCPVRPHCAAHARGLSGELPRLAKKKATPTLARVAVVAAKADRFLLSRRVPGGTFGGMWEPPSIDAPLADGDPRRALEALVGARLSGLERVGQIVHVLTHRRLEVLVYRAKLGRKQPRAPSADYDAFVLLRLEDEIGLTTFARKILAAADGQTLRSSAK